MYRYVAAAEAIGEKLDFMTSTEFFMLQALQYKD